MENIEIIRGVQKKLFDMKKERVKNNRPISIELFAGAGGLALGLEKANYQDRKSVV